MPSGYQQVVQTLRKTTKFNDYHVLTDSQTTEPYIREKVDKKVFFGFVNMEGATTDRSSQNSSMLEIECPRECTSSTRRWICTRCGDYVTIKKTKLDPSFCSALVDQRDTKMNYSSVIIQVTDQKTRRKKTLVFNYNDLLPKIRQELQIIKDRDEGRTDIRIYTAIMYLSGKKNEQEVRDALTNLQGLDLVATTRRMIELYLNRNY